MFSILYFICLELPSHSEKYFGFVVDEFSALVHDKMRCWRHFELSVAIPASQNAQNLDGISHSNVPGAFEVCLELSSNSKDQVSLVADEFCELVHTTEIATFLTLFVTRPASPASQKHSKFV